MQRRTAFQLSSSAVTSVRLVVGLVVYSLASTRLDTLLAAPTFLLTPTHPTRHTGLLHLPSSQSSKRRRPGRAQPVHAAQERPSGSGHGRGRWAGRRPRWPWRRARDAQQAVPGERCPEGMTACVPVHGVARRCVPCICTWTVRPSSDTASAGASWFAHGDNQQVSSQRCPSAPHSTMLAFRCVASHPSKGQQQARRHQHAARGRS